MTASPYSPQLALGTAQLGMNYGIGNKRGKPSEEAALAIVETAWKCGIRHFDTAGGYGDAQERLGRIFRRLGIQKDVHIITKVGDISECTPSAQVALAKEQLGLEQIWGLLLHREEDLATLPPQNAWTSLAPRFGVSVYAPAVATQALDTAGVSLLQVPANIFDRRFLSQEFLRRVQANGAMLMIRSVFLQGLALMEPSQVPTDIPYATKAVGLLDAFCKAKNLDRKSFCIHYLAYKTKDIPALLVFGAEAVSQVEEIVLAARQANMDSAYWREWEGVWPDYPEVLVNPSLWPKRI